jgi:hypothetical protein
VCVCVRAQTEQLSGVVDGLRKKKDERKKRRRKKRMFYSLCNDKSLSLVGVFFYIEKQ